MEETQGLRPELTPLSFGVDPDEGTDSGIRFWQNHPNLICPLTQNYKSTDKETYHNISILNMMGRHCLIPASFKPINVKRQNIFKLDLWREPTML